MKFKLPNSVLNGILSELQSLRPSDVITKSRLAMKGNLDVTSAERILAELVNEGVLEMIFAVSCKNEEEGHTVLFNGFDELYQNQDKTCPYCESEMNFEDIRVGFKRRA